MTEEKGKELFRVQKNQKRIYVECLRNMIDISNAAQFKDEAGKWLKEDIVEIVMDVKKVDFVDSMGLGMLISIHKRVSEKNARMILKNPSENFKRLLSITGLNKVFFFE